MVAPKSVKFKLSDTSRALSIKDVSSEEEGEGTPERSHGEIWEVPYTYLCSIKEENSRKF